MGDGGPPVELPRLAIRRRGDRAGRRGHPWRLRRGLDWPPGRSTGRRRRGPAAPREGLLARPYLSERWQMIADAYRLPPGEVPGVARRPRGLVNIFGLKSIALDALGRTGDGHDIARRAAPRPSLQAGAGRPRQLMTPAQARTRDACRAGSRPRISMTAPDGPDHRATWPFAGRWLPPEWPLVFMLAGYPVWWFLGAGALIWPLFSLPMLGRLVMRRRTVRGATRLRVVAALPRLDAGVGHPAPRRRTVSPSSGGPATTSRPPSRSSTSTTPPGTGCPPGGSSSSWPGSGS